MTVGLSSISNDQDMPGFQAFLIVVIRDIIGRQLFEMKVRYGLWICFPLLKKRKMVSN